MKLEKSKIEEAKSVDLVSLLDRYGVTMQKQGAEFFGLCPFHTETTPSFNVTPRVNLFKCFGCGESGDPIEFIKKYLGVGFVDAVKIINNDATGPDATIQKRDRVKIPEKPKFETAQVPDNAPAPKEFKWLRAPAGFEVPSSYKTFTGKDGAVLVKHIAVKHWEYRDADGKLLGYVTRFNQAWGGKQTLPQTWCVDSKTGELGWQWQAFSEPRPLYGLDLLAANPDAQVMVVEGEKACDSARVLAASLRITAAQLVIVSWPGGCQSVSRADWSPLYGRRVALWPDADQKPYPENHERAGELMPFEEQPGTDAMRSVYRLLAEHCETVKLIMPPAGVPDGWDLADELPAGFHFIKHLKEASRPAADVFPDAARVPVAEATDAETVPEHDEYLQSMMVRLDPAEAVQHQMIEDHQVPSSGEDELTENGYFRVLGFDHDRYFFMQYEKRQIMVYSKGDFSESGLIELAPLEFWETYFAGESTKIDKRAAMNWIIRLAHLRGIYDTSRLRGRGAWVDAGRYVYHHGSHLTVDGERYDIRDFKTRFAYEMSRSLPDISDDPLTNEEGRDIVELSEMFRWSKPASAPLLAGWIALAPICGALRWRPHIWVSGGPGSGKTTVLNRFVNPLMNGMGVFVQGNSTEAGIRQYLKCDALPVLFDESESNTDREAVRIQNVLSMIRQASSESQALTLKGTAGGDAMSFHIRSMFCLSSIQVGIKYQADIERVTVLNLQPKRDEANASEKWKEMDSLLYSLERDAKLSPRLVARSINLLPKTLKNIVTFAEAGAIKFGSQRDGDQYGTLMAGAYSLMSDDLVTLDGALAMLDSYDWSEHREGAESDEGERAMGALMQALIRIAGVEISVNELIRVACNVHVEGCSYSDPSNAAAVLERYGMRIDQVENVLILQNNSKNLQELMAGTPFETDLRGVMLRVRGAAKYRKPIKFGGVLSRAVTVPLSPLLNDDAVAELTNGQKVTF